MKAKCPYCDKGCDKCNEGYIEVKFSTEGHYHYMICNACGENNGGHLHTKDRPLPEKPSKYSVCPHCGSHDLRFSTCEESQ